MQKSVNFNLPGGIAAKVIVASALYGGLDGIVENALDILNGKKGKKDVVVNLVTPNESVFFIETVDNKNWEKALELSKKYKLGSGQSFASFLTALFNNLALVKTDKGLKFVHTG